MNRRGFTLIEVMVALVMLAIVVTGVARASTAIAVFGRRTDLAAKRTAALQLESNKFGAVPYANLATWSTSDQTFTRGDFTYTRKLTITSQNATNTRYLIKIVVVPSTDPTKKDSAMFERTMPPSGSPLCVGC
jgi:prepilin-type N-terminal cleavage/methylation domain-containing protein